MNGTAIALEIGNDGKECLHPNHQTFPFAVYLKEPPV